MEGRESEKKRPLHKLADEKGRQRKKEAAKLLPPAAALTNTKSIKNCGNKMATTSSKYYSTRNDQYSVLTQCFEIHDNL